MYIGYRKAPLDSKRFPRRSRPVVGGDFRKKFLVFALTGTAGSLALFFVPMCLFLYQNYKNFQSLAFDIQPEIIVNLEQETFWLIMFALTSAVVLISLVAFLTYQMTRQLTRPLQEVQDHMNKVIRSDLTEPFEIDETDSLKDYMKSYKSLIEFFQIDYKMELDYLRRLQIDPQNRDAHRAWRSLIDLKERRLGMKKPKDLFTILNAEESDGSDFERRAS